MKKLFFGILFLASLTIQAQFKDSTSVSIDSAGTTSAAIDTEDQALVALKLPKSFTGTALTFLTSPDTVSANFLPVFEYDDTEITVTVDTADYNNGGGYVLLKPIWMYAFDRYIKVVSDSTEADTRTIITRHRGI